VIDRIVDWIKQRGMPALPRREPEAQAPPPRGRAMSGKYVRLYKYLEERYANSVVLTFAQIEDVLGFALPDQARVNPEWWTGAQEGVGPNYSDSWILASRTALPNLPARTVLFNRTP
jgi:hypothetical protein